MLITNKIVFYKSIQVWFNQQNFKEHKVLDYKRLKNKEVSEEQERLMIEEINKKFGGIDMILSKAAQANPSIG